MPQRKFLSGSFLAILLLPVLIAGVWLDWQERQLRLDRALIQAIKSDDTTTAITLLHDGADANATDRPPPPSMSLRSVLSDLWGRLHGTPPQTNTACNPPALMLVYRRIIFSEPHGYSSEILYECDDMAELAPPSHRGAPSSLVSALLHHGAVLDPKEGVGNRLLAYACICGDARTVRVLLEHHIDPNATLEGYPCLMCTQSYDCVRLLLDFGANVNRRDSSGRTALMLIENTALYPLLVEYGAKVSIKDGNGKSALDYANDPDWHDRVVVHLLEEALKNEQAEQKALIRNP